MTVSFSTLAEKARFGGFVLLCIDFSLSGG